MQLLVGGYIINIEPGIIVKLVHFFILIKFFQDRDVPIDRKEVNSPTENVQK